MKLTKSCLIAFACAFFSDGLLKAQSEGSAFNLTGMGVSTPFARDYQTLGINPANLDLTPAYDRYATIGFAETAFSFYSGVLTKPELRQNIFREDIKDFSQSEQLDLATEFAKSANAFDIDVTAFGFSLRTERAGTFAFAVKDRVDYYSKLGQQVSELMWLGYSAPYFDSLVVHKANGFDTIPNSPNIDAQTLSNVVQGFTNIANAQSMSQLLQGTKFGFSWFREFNLGYGKRLYNRNNLEIHGGLGVKLLIGQGMVDIDATGSNVTAFSALSPIFNVNYGNIATQNPSSLGDNAPPLNPVGIGYGIDLGTTIVFKKKWIASIAVNDLGSITWDGNVYVLNDIKLQNFDNSGLESADFLAQVDQINGSDGLLKWTGTESRTTKLPSTTRIGFGYDALGKFKVGVDIIAPLGDNIASIQKAAISFGGEFSPVRWVHLQAGYSTGGNYGTKIPVGIYFTIGKGTYEFGVSSRDLVTFFRNNDPTVSLAVGFLRFRF